MDYQQMIALLEQGKLMTRHKFYDAKHIHFYSYFWPDMKLNSPLCIMHFKLNRKDDFSMIESYEFNQEEKNAADWYCLPDDFYLRWQNEVKIA